MTSMKWLTNTHKSEAQQVTAQLCAGWIGRRIVEGDPAATETYSAQSLSAMGMVGLYHVGADEPVTAEIVWPGQGR